MRRQLTSAALAVTGALVSALPKPASAYFLLADTPGGEVCSNGTCNGNNLVAQYLYGTGSPTVSSSGGGNGCLTCNTASVSLATGKLETYASSNYGTIGIADAQIGAPVTISGATCTGPGISCSGGSVIATMFITGTYLYNSNSTASVSASLELFDPTTGADSPQSLFQELDGSSPEGQVNSFSYELQAMVPVDTLVGFDASISLETSNSAWIDVSHTTTFGLSVPDGFTYSSPFSFIGPETAVPEPGSLVMLLTGIGAVRAVRRRRSARHNS
jgi:hypothetical protein